MACSLETGDVYASALLVEGSRRGDVGGNRLHISINLLLEQPQQVLSVSVLSHGRVQGLVRFPLVGRGPEIEDGRGFPVQPIRRP